MTRHTGHSGIRSTIVALVTATLAAAGAVTVLPTAASAQSTGEYQGADCQVSVPDPGSVPSNSLLPDPFTKLDGTRIAATSEWECRRAEIKETAEQYVYGEKPIPDNVTGTVTSSSITVNVSDNGRSTSFSAGVDLPGGSGPFPAVIVLGGFGADTGTISSAGAAVISYDPYDVGQEGTSRSNKQGAFYDIYGSSSSTGLLAAWAWGVSRIIDVIEESGGNILRADATGVTGCSRFGKGAFVSGAFDQRVALTMPIESGTGGVPAFRSVAQEGGAQPLSSAYGEQPWLGDAFNSFTGNPAGLPVDTHELVAMVAPRGLFIMENPHVDWLGAQSGSVAALAGAEVYQALGVADNISYWSDVQDGTHCASRSEWQGPLQQNIQKFLLNQAGNTGDFRIAGSAAGNLSQWRDWSTPDLSDGPTTPPTTTPPTTTPPTTTPPTTTPPTTTPPTTTPPTTTPPVGGDCTASVSVNQWPGGFVATVRVTAESSSLNGWSVSVALPAGAGVSHAWNADPSGSSGTVEFTNLSYNGSVPVGQSTEFGFQGTGTGTGMTASCAAG